MIVALLASRDARHVEVRHRNTRFRVPPLSARAICPLPPTCGDDRSTRPDEARNLLYQHLISRLVQGWECGVLTTWKSLPVTVSGIHQ